MKKIFFYIFIIILNFSILSAKSIFFENLKRLSVDDLKSISNYNLELDNYNEGEINLIIKELLSSDLIIDIDLKSDRSSFFLNITEAFFINEIFINNNIIIKDEDIFNYLSTTPKSYFNTNNINNDIVLIKDIYKTKGYNDVIVNTYLEEFANNSFQLIFDVTENTQKEIKDILFIGNKFLNDKYLKSRIKTKKAKFSLFSRNSSLKKIDINNDKNVMTDLYMDYGFLDVEINYSIKSKDKSFILYFEINEGNRYIIESIEHEKLKLDNKEFANSFKNFKSVSLQEPFSLIDIETFISKVNKLLSESNLPNYNYDYSYLKEDNDKIFLNFNLTKFKPIYISKINILGNNFTKDKTIRDLVPIKPGDLYNQNQIKKLKNTIIQKPYIADTNIQLNTINNEIPELDIEVNEIDKTGSFSIGATYNSSIGATTSFGIKDSNLFGTGNKIDSSISVGSKNLLFDLAYTKYRLFDLNIDNTYKIFNTSDDKKKTSGYKEKSKGLGYFFKIPLIDNNLLSKYYSIGFDYEHNEVYDLSSNVSSAVSQSAGKSNNLILNSSYIVDSTDNSFNPKNGSYKSYNMSISPNSISDDGYLRIKIANNFYKQIKRTENNLFLLTQLGYAQGLGSKIKTRNSFSLGGSDFKGFDYSGIGSRDSSKNYLGGTKIYLLTLGYSTPVIFDNSDSLILRYYSTIGSLFDSEFQSTFDSSSPRISIGSSIDLLTPIGPMSISASMPIVKKSYDKTETINFSIGTSF